MLALVRHRPGDIDPEERERAQPEVSVVADHERTANGTQQSVGQVRQLRGKCDCARGQSQLSDPEPDWADDPADGKVQVLPGPAVQHRHHADD